MTAIAAWNSGQQNLTGDGEPVRIGVGFVTANTFDVLGARPLLGRVITEQEDAPNGPQVAVLGYPIWQARYGGDPNVIGRRLMINDVPVEVIGVMPEGFRLPTDFNDDAAEPTQLWRPIAVGHDAARAQSRLLRRGDAGAGTIRRVGHRGAARDLPAAHRAGRVSRPAMQFSAFAVPLDEEIRGGIRPAMWLLMGAVGFLLLIACANVANLLLVRGDARLREMAVRTAIGAAPDRLVRQLLTESVVLALMGALLGLGLASIGLRVLMTVDPTSLPPLAPVRLDWPVVAFTLVLGVITTIVFGLVPALRTLARQPGRLAARRRSVHGRRASAAPAQRARDRRSIARGRARDRRGPDGAKPRRARPDRSRIQGGSCPDDARVGAGGAVRHAREGGRLLSAAERQGARACRACNRRASCACCRLATTIGDFGLDVEGFEERPERMRKAIGRSRPTDRSRRWERG